MNKTTTKKKIEELFLTSPQDNDGQYELGSEGQRKAAKLVEEAYNADTLSDETIPHVLLALKDIQVRDYTMGFINPRAENTKLFFKSLVKHAPVDYIAAPTTLLALTYYENSQDGKANELLRPVAAKGYSLALLLGRVFQSNWPTDEFNKMRIQLHPKVTAAIFGEETNDNSNA
jgi:hypothetical protein